VRRVGGRAGLNSTNVLGEKERTKLTRRPVFRRTAPRKDGSSGAGATTEGAAPRSVDSGSQKVVSMSAARKKKREKVGKKRSAPLGGLTKEVEAQFRRTGKKVYSIRKRKRLCRKTNEYLQSTEKERGGKKKKSTEVTISKKLSAKTQRTWRRPTASESHEKGKSGKEQRGSLGEVRGPSPRSQGKKNRKGKVGLEKESFKGDRKPEYRATVNVLQKKKGTRVNNHMKERG